MELSFEIEVGSIKNGMEREIDEEDGALKPFLKIKGLGDFL